MLKRFATLIAALVLIGAVVAPLRAQDAPQKFTLSGKALGYISGGAGLVAADAAANINTSPKFSLRTDNIVISAAASQASLAVFNLAGAQFNLPAVPVFKAVGLDATQYGAYALGEFGSVTNAGGVSQAISVGAGVDRKLSANVTVNLFEVRWLHGPVPIGNAAAGAPQYVHNGFAVSAGFTF